MDEFTSDSFSLAGDCRTREIHRRGLLRLAGALGIAASGLLSATAARTATEVVLVNWGGDAVAAAKKAYGEPFERATGIKMAVDSAGPSAGKIRAMVESKRVTWDVMDTTFGDAGELGSRGLLEPIDYTIVDKSKVLDGFAQPDAVAGYGYSNILAYDASKFPDRRPQSWADFWNLKDYPGKRMLGRPLGGNLEAALQADGVPRDKLYPLDVQRAFKKIAEIKKDCVFWSSGAQSHELLRDSEVTMGQLWSTRAFLLHKDTNGRIVTVWNQGMFQTNAWTVPKGNPAGKDAMRLIASMQDLPGQVEMLRLIGFGPVNPAAAALVPAELRTQNPSDPQNLTDQVRADVQWYSENQTKVVQQYLDLIAS
jgi:putative spermidine/putrescine transport system substrate-binding protein